MTEEKKYHITISEDLWFSLNEQERKELCKELKKEKPLSVTMRNLQEIK
jgi:hypothetical protein